MFNTCKRFCSATSMADFSHVLEHWKCRSFQCAVSGDDSVCKRDQKVLDDKEAELITHNSFYKVC